MFERQPDNLREKVQKLAHEALEKSEPSAWFDVLYSEAKGEASQVPWARLSVHPYLQNWLDTDEIRGEGRLALAIGCGLGDDAEGLQARGFQVTAFDISPTAIAWCRDRFPNSAVHYLVADLLALPSEWREKFDLVVESRNIQALPLNIRDRAIAAVAGAIAPQGTLAVITRIRETEDPPEGPPWALSESEISQFQNWGLQEIRRQGFTENTPTGVVRQLFIEYRRLIGLPSN